MFKILYAIVLLFCFNYVTGQTLKTKKWRKTELDSLEKAQHHFVEKNYSSALPIYENLLRSHPKEIYLKYVTGVCFLYQSDKHKEAFALLTEVYEKNKKAPDIELDLAKACHLNYKFDEAINHCKVCMTRKNVSITTKKDAAHLIEYCNNAKEFTANPKPNVEISNLTGAINSTESEYVPVISSDESVLIYTYRGEKSTGGRQNENNSPDDLGMYYEDIFISEKNNANGTWSDPKGISNVINTVEHDAAVSLSNDGKKLFVYRDDRSNGGDIYVSIFKDSAWTYPEKVYGISTRSWEGSASLSADEKTLYFSSDRPGGKGGKDIYKATLNKDSMWGNIQNMGPKINTQYDDDAPFIHPNGTTLLYSSKGHNSMGGYDIFRAEMTNEDTVNVIAKNLGYPINTPDDDIYYILNADGSRGYYSSGKEGGSGLQDIYVVSPGMDDFKAAIILVKGTVTLDKNPVDAEIIIKNSSDQVVFNTIHSSAKNGAYLVNLPAGKNFSLIYRVKGMQEILKNIDATAITIFKQEVLDVEFNSAPPVALVDSTVLSDPSVSIPVSKLDNPNNTSPREYLSANFGNKTLAGLSYRVQIAAYKMPQNYVWKNLDGLGSVDNIILDDGVTRFTIGGIFNTYNDAIKLCEKVKGKGQQDAFVTAIYKGRRVYLEELVKLLGE